MRKKKVAPPANEVKFPEKILGTLLKGSPFRRKAPILRNTQTAPKKCVVKKIGKNLT